MDPGFFLPFIWGGGGGEGGAKDYVRARTSRARNLKSLTAGVQGPHKGPGSSRVFDAFSCYLSLNC